ncbi:MAG: hypothetical protein ABIR30_05555 [Chitinophagaceae bacterium]
MNGLTPRFSITLPAWSTRRKIAFRFLLVFTVLFILTLPFPKPYIPDIASAMAPFFERIIHWLGDHLFKIKGYYSSRLISDSTGLYIHLLLLLFLTFLVTLVWSIADKKRNSYHMLAWWFRVVASYYLAFFLLSYGLNKLFKWQFYLPEPNTLFTSMGNTYRDLLYWSTMGTSHSYNVFLGSLEIVAALLLLFRKTRLTGSLLAFMIMLNVVAINFSFDISVKIFSCFLLFLSVIIALPDGKRLYTFFFTGKTSVGYQWQPEYVSPRMKSLYIAGKCLIVAYMLTSLLSVYIRSGNFNDDKAARPEFHGAYDISFFIKNNDTLPPLTTDTYRWKRMFIHRRGWLIIQSMNDAMQDYLFQADTVKKQWVIKMQKGSGEAVLNYQQTSDTTIRLRSKIGADSLDIYLQRIDLAKLPLMQKEFNWTVEQ